MRVSWTPSLLVDSSQGILKIHQSDHPLKGITGHPSPSIVIRGQSSISQNAKGVVYYKPNYNIFNIDTVCLRWPGYLSVFPKSPQGKDVLKSHWHRTGKMAQWLRAFASLADQLGLVPSIHMVVTTVCTLVPRGLLEPLFTRQACDTHLYIQAVKHSYTWKIN